VTEEVDIEIRVLTSTRDLDDYDVLALNTISAAVPHKTSDGLRKLIWAAMVAHMFGNKSVDHVLRRYEHLWERFRPHARETSPQILALRQMAAQVDAIASALERVDPGALIGQICAKSALCRLEATFKAAYGLVRKNYIFETEAVVRLILEQMAWSCAAARIGDESVFYLNPTKCVGSFKSLYPDAGRIYGELSEGAHIDPSIAANYIRFHENGVPVVRRSRSDALASGARLLELAEVYAKVVQHLFSPLPMPEYEMISQELLDARANYGV
jgi:hypothetical protein